MFTKPYYLESHRRAARCFIGIGVLMIGILAEDARGEECAFEGVGAIGATSVNGVGAAACGANSNANGAGAVAIGMDAVAADSHATAIGMGALATRLDSETPLDLPDISATFAALAIGPQAAAAGFDSLAIGRGAVAGTVSDPDANDGTYALGLADFAIAIGGMTRAGEEFAVAIGQGAAANGKRALALGAASQATGNGAIALGADAGNGDALGALAYASNAIALGADAVVSIGATDSVAIGRGASVAVSASSAIAFGANATASAQRSVAIGPDAQSLAVNAFAGGVGADANGTNSAGVGYLAIAGGDGSAAFGGEAEATASGTTAVGRSASAEAGGSTAIGREASTLANNSTAVGRSATVGGSGSRATAIGYQANANHNLSTAVGARSITTANDQVMLGGAGSSVAVGDIDASTAAQDGQLYAVTVDDSGTLGKGDALASAQAVQSLGNNFRQVASFHDAEILALTSRVDTLDFQLQDLDESTRGGIATSMAMGGMMIVPDSTISVSLNGSTYRGEQGFAGGITARVAPKVYVSATVAGSTAKNTTGGRVGVAFGF